MVGTVLTVHGEFEGFRLLSYDPRKYDPTKTLCEADIKHILVKAQGEVVKTLQLKLKQPKTARTLPIQIVEMPETGGLMWSVKAYKDWRTHRKEPIIGGHPVYSWACGALVTMGDINKIMEALLPGESKKMTTRAFRPA